MRERFTEQLNIGIQVRVVEHRIVPKELRRNFLICDDTWVIDSRFDRDGKTDGGSISKDESEVHLALEKWADLVGLSEEIADVDQYSNPNSPVQTP